MTIYRGNVEGYPRKAGADFTQEYIPAKEDTVLNAVIPITANTDNVTTIVQNVPKKNEGAFCPKVGELVKFVAAGATTKGQSLRAVVGASPLCWRMTPITLAASGGTRTRRIGVVVEGTNAIDEIGLMEFRNDEVYV